MALPEFTMRQLLEAGVHFGHQTQRWNPRMSEFIYGSRNGIHIIDLTRTVPMLDAALNAMRETVAKGGRILFVGTKRQASGPIAEAAEKCDQYYMNHRWLGGTLTNWQTVSKSIQRLAEIEEKISGGAEGLTKKERLGLEREQNKLQSSLGGIREMGGVPDLIFVIDVKKEALAVAEANKLGIPVVAVVDTNCRPEGINYIIPGNDDAARAISLYCDLAARAALDGISAQLDAAGVDMGEMEDAPVEEVISKDAASKGPITEKRQPKKKLVAKDSAKEKTTAKKEPAEAAKKEKLATTDAKAPVKEKAAAKEKVPAKKKPAATAAKAKTTVKKKPTTTAAKAPAKEKAAAKKKPAASTTKAATKAKTTTKKKPVKAATKAPAKAKTAVKTKAKS